MADKFYKVRKVRGKEEYAIKRRDTGETVGTSKTREKARKSAHIRGDNSRRYGGPKFKG